MTGVRARREEDRVEAVDILIAESDPLEAKIVHGALDRLLNNRVTVLTDAEETLDYLLQRGGYAEERRAPDLIILDVDLIGDDCWEMLSGLRDRPGLEEAMIVVISSSASIAQAGRAEDAGVNWYSGKPINLENLSRIIEDLEDLGIAVIRARVPRREDD